MHESMDSGQSEAGSGQLDSWLAQGHPGGTRQLAEGSPGPRFSYSPIRKGTGETESRRTGGADDRLSFAIHKWAGYGEKRSSGGRGECAQDSGGVAGQD